MNQSDYANFQMERDLMNCGLTEDSISSIKATTVVTHNGAQHVVPTSQRDRLDAAKRGDVDSQQSISETHMSDNMHGTVAFQEQQRMFSRFKEHSNNRLSILEKAHNEAVKEINDLKQQIETIKSNLVAQRKNYEQQISDSKHQHSRSQTPDSHSQSRADSRTSSSDDQPIDRNKTAPADVKVESIFYCGHR
ncbi:MAG: hypothetical protein ACOCU6_02500 [Nanoarchaeota archaeon]